MENSQHTSKAQLKLHMSHRPASTQMRLRSMHGVGRGQCSSGRISKLQCLMLMILLNCRLRNAALHLCISTVVHCFESCCCSTSLLLWLLTCPGWEVLRSEVHEEARNHQAEAGRSHQQREAFDGSEASSNISLHINF